MSVYGRGGGGGGVWRLEFDEREASLRVPPS